MEQKLFKSKIEKCFYGQGGQFFKERYKEMSRSSPGDVENDNLDNIIANIMKTLDDEFEDPDSDEVLLIRKLKGLNTKTIKNKILFLKEYFKDRQCSRPELCGYISGVMAKEKMFDEICDLLDLDNFDLNDPEDYYCWDS